MSPESPPLHALQPDPLEPDSEDVERYVMALRELARTDPGTARREAWRQFRLAGARAGSRPAEAADTLNRIFRLGAPPSQPLDGFLEGIIVTPLAGRPADPVLRALTRAWMPWAGKRFDSRGATGVNVLERAARIPARLVWPRYGLEDVGDGHCAGFRFRTRIDAGRDDPDRQTLKLDYDLDENPGLVIRDLLDELVEVVPGAYLGKIMLRRVGDWRLAGYFALRPAETVRVHHAAGATRAADPSPSPAPA